jgi:4-amino-4-deoxy-L-arabinose transferase-like glycosyltransferase
MTRAASRARAIGTSASDGAGKQRLRSWVSVFGLFAFATAWNLTKPYHIDDPAYLEIAQWIAGHPLHPMRGTLFWGDTPVSIQLVNQPHLYFYLMALWGRVFGWSEVAMHSLMALCALAAIALMHRLARIVVPDGALLATALVATSPVFVVGQNTMVDVPVLTLWLLFFVILLVPRESRERDASRYLAAGVVCGAAILVKYTSLVLIPALVIDGLLRRRPSAAYGVLAAVIIVIAWCAFNYWDYGGVHMLTRVAVNGGWHVLDPSLWLLCLGATAPFSFPLAAASIQGPSRFARVAAVLLWITFLAALALIIASTVGTIGRTASDAAFVALFLTSGATLIALAGRGVLRARVSAPASSIAKPMLAYWSLSALVFVVLFAPFVAMRHVLLALPPLVLLAIMAIPPRARRRAGIVAVATTLVLTSIVASADRWYARIYRDEAKRLREMLPASANVWTVGHWGWQWYARQNDMKEFVPGESLLAAGDFIVYPEHVHRQPLPSNLAITNLRTVTITPDNWVRAFAGPHAGFYATLSFEQLPWAVRRDPIEIFHILRVEATPDS